MGGIRRIELIAELRCTAGSYRRAAIAAGLAPIIPVVAKTLFFDFPALPVDSLKVADSFGRGRICHCHFSEIDPYRRDLPFCGELAFRAWGRPYVRLYQFLKYAAVMAKEIKHQQLRHQPRRPWCRKVQHLRHR